MEIKKLLWEIFRHGSEPSSCKSTLSMFLSDFDECFLFPRILWEQLFDSPLDLEPDCAGFSPARLMVTLDVGWKPPFWLWRVDVGSWDFITGKKGDEKKKSPAW